MYLSNLYKKSYSGVDREIWMLALISFVNRVGSMVLPFLTIYLSSIKNYSLSLTGLVMMGYGIGSFFGNWAGGILSDRIGPFRLQLMSLLSSGLALYVLLWLDSPVSIALGLFCCSFLADAFRPANMASVAALSSDQSRTKAVGVTRLAFNLGFSAGPALGGIIAVNLGYNWLFIIDGSSCILAGFIFFLFFRKQIFSEHRSIKKSKDASEEQPHMRHLFRDRPFLIFMLLMFIYGVIFMQFFSSVPVFFKNKLLYTEDYIGILMALNGLLVVIIELPIIHLIEKKGQMRMMAFGTLMVGTAFLLLLPGKFMVFAILATLMFTLGEVFSLPFATTVVLNRSSEKMRARYMAFYGMTFSLCHIAAPVFGMFIADKFSFTALWIILAVLMMLCSRALYSLRKTMQ
jgi:predicted MFS family arabinose efflux permease